MLAIRDVQYDKYFGANKLVCFFYKFVRCSALYYHSNSNIVSETVCAVCHRGIAKDNIIMTYYRHRGHDSGTTVLHREFGHFV